MQTPLILNSTIAVQHAAPAAKQGTDTAPAGQFNQVLSRQMKERQSPPENKPVAQSKDNAAAPKPTAGPSNAAAKPSSDKEKTKEAADDSDEKTESLPTASTELMALVAQFTQATAKPTNPDTSSSKEGESTIEVDDATEKPGKQLVHFNPSEQLDATLTAEANSKNGIPINQSREQNISFGNQPTMQETLTELSAAGKKQEILTDPLSVSKTQDPLSNLAMAAPQLIPVDVLQATSGRPTEKLSPHVGTPAWDQALGQKIVWMAGGAQQTASLTLNPPDLGPLQVVLNVSNDQANATFISAQPEVRQAIEAALPKLREMMGDAGIQLGQTNINAGNGGQQSSSGEQAKPFPSNFAHGNSSVDIPVSAALPPGALPIQGLVNTFA